MMTFCTMTLKSHLTREIKKIFLGNISGTMSSTSQKIEHSARAFNIQYIKSMYV